MGSSLTISTTKIAPFQKIETPVEKAEKTMRAFRYKMVCAGVKFKHILDPLQVIIKPHPEFYEKPTYIVAPLYGMNLRDRIHDIDESLTSEEKKEIISSLLHTLLFTHNHGYWNLSLRLDSVHLCMLPAAFLSRVFVNPEQLMYNPDLFDDGIERPFADTPVIRGAKSLDMIQVAKIIAHIELHTLDEQAVMEWLKAPYPETKDLCSMHAVVILLMRGANRGITAADVLNMFFQDKPNTTASKLKQQLSAKLAAGA